MIIMKIKVRLFDERGEREKFNIHVDGDPLKILSESRIKIETLFQKKEGE